jgi:omega-amidase
VARAIENQCFVIAVNRIGADGNLVMHSGDSMVIDPFGNVISVTKPHEQRVETIALDAEVLLNARQKFPVGLDADDFGLKVD